MATERSLEERRALFDQLIRRALVKRIFRKRFAGTVPPQMEDDVKQDAHLELWSRVTHLWDESKGPWLKYASMRCYYALKRSFHSRHLGAIPEVPVSQLKIDPTKNVFAPETDQRTKYTFPRTVSEVSDVMCPRNAAAFRMAAAGHQLSHITSTLGFASNKATSSMITDGVRQAQKCYGIEVDRSRRYSHRFPQRGKADEALEVQQQADAGRQQGLPLEVGGGMLPDVA